MKSGLEKEGMEMNLLLIDKLNNKIDALQDQVQKNNWNNLRKEHLVKELDDAITCLKGLDEIFHEEIKELKKHASIDYLKTDEFFQEFKKNLEFLERNLKLEKEKGKETQLHEINLFETNVAPELYAELQRKVLGQIIKARFLIERIGIAVQKEETHELGKKTVARKALDLLEEKEEELQSLKEKYAEIRRKSFLGMVQEKNVVDLEEKLNKTNISLEKNKSELNNRVREYSRKLMQLQKEFIELNKEKNSLEHAFEKYIEEARELIPLLKKERDYAKKLVLDIENESLRLREHYSRELLNFEQSKQQVQEDTEEKYERIISDLRAEIVERDRNLMHLKKTIEALLKVKKGIKRQTGKKHE